MIDAVTEGLDLYVVGGAVRDELLGVVPGDRDWVVVGSTPQEMMRRGFLPVGADFPVFLHPQTKEEFALARTERKSGRGYKGFTFYAGADVTLEQDLQRRDLTINAMAKSPSGELIDPIRGAEDLAQKRLKHVGPAFEEDPVRILRLARFAARFFEFEVAPQTYTLCQRMVALGEADALVPERVWQEISRGLLSERPSRLFEVLIESTALPVIMPDFVYEASLGQRLDAHAGAPSKSLPAMYALAMSLSSNRQALAKRLRASSECVAWADLLPVVNEACQTIADVADESRAEQIMRLFEKSDAIRRPERFLGVLEIVDQLTPGLHDALKRALNAARQIDAGLVARAAQSGGAQAIAQAVRQARLAAVAAA
jgi:tRNA nucleotidyltransferase (CCA-adding enzyme)